MSRRQVTGGLGEVVRTRRKTLGMSQSELAAKVGVTQTYISNMELDRVQLPNVQIRRDLSESLRMSHLELLMAIGEIRQDEVPGAASVRPVIYGLLELLDGLPPASRLAVEQVIRDVAAAHAAGEGDEGGSG